MCLERPQTGGPLMKICFISSTAARCGIAQYTRNLAKALSHYAQVRVIDASETASSPHLIRQTDEFDIVHIQYETSHFFSGTSDRYEKICRTIRKPIIVTLHEIYRTPPDVFPREQITGLTRPLRLFRYDLRHPYQTAFRRHVKRDFFADCIHVHYPYQTGILRRLCPTATEVYELPHFVPNMQAEKHTKLHRRTEPTIRLGAGGFIGSGYDFPVLIQTLERLTFPWYFTWIGGPRTTDGENLLNALRSQIDTRNLSDRFRITGWVSEDNLVHSLNELDFYLAFHRSKSTSGSICTALGAHLPILATSSELVSDIKRDSEALTDAASDSGELSQRLHDLVCNRSEAERLRCNAAEYAHRRSLQNTAQLLYKRYQGLQFGHQQAIKR